MLPGINPNAPVPLPAPTMQPPPAPMPVAPVPAVAPVPEPVPAPIPAPMPAPMPAPVPAPVPMPEPVPAPAPAPVPSVAPAPAPAAVKPTTFTQMNFQVTGIDQATFNKNLAAYNVVMGKAGGVEPSWVDATASAVAAPAAAPSGRRLMAVTTSMGASTPLAIDNTLYTSDPAGTQASLQQAVADGSLARELSALGMSLNTNSIVYPSVAPAPAPSSGGGSNTGAIVGGVIGGVAGVVIIGGLAFYLLRKRKASKEGSLPTVATGSKSGEAMYTANPAFDDKAIGDDAAIPPPAQKPTTTSFNNNMFAADPLDTPKTSARESAAIAGVNPMYETNQSQLSEPEAERGGYTPSDVSGAMSARSRLDSARSGLRSNPMFTQTQDIIESDDDEFADANANPLYQSARSGTDIMQSANSDLALDSSRTYDTAVTGSASARGTGSAQPSARSNQPVSNPMFGTDNVPDAANPLFQEQAKK